MVIIGKDHHCYRPYKSIPGAQSSRMEKDEEWLGVQREDNPA